LSRRHYDLPPLTTLTAFETAARHLSFKNAAQELSVTPGAVSHQIKALEGELGVMLFERRHRGVQLTPAGQQLFETLRKSFQEISRQLLKVRKYDEAQTITVGSTTAVSALWLSPAIIEFWKEYPEISVNQITQDRPFQDPRSFDFIIKYGQGADPSLAHTAVYRDELVAVAKSELSKQLEHCSLQSLASQKLIHLDAKSQSWTTWSDWFQELGYEGHISVGTRVTSYSVALQFAGQGAGVALGWRRLIRPLIDSHKLTIVGNFAVQAPKQFHIVGPADSELTEQARTLKNWILRDAHLPSI
jgi:DNA-binding transcriptional LysR family regulator